MYTLVLGLGALHRVDGELSVHADRVFGVGGLLLGDLLIRAQLEQGRLSLGPLDFKYEDGAITGSLELDSQASPTTLALAADAKGMRLERLVAQFDETGAYSGQVHARVDLRSRGDSLHALASNLEGEVAASIDAGSISVEHSSLLTRDVARAIRSAVHYRKSELLNCMIAGFDFRDGVGTAEHVVLDSEDIVVRAEGTVDLGAEEIQMRLVPRLHHPSLLSTAGTVRLSGFLDDPQVKLEKGSLLRSMGEAFAANVVTLSGLRKLWLLLTGREFTGSHCERLLADPNDPNG